MAGFKSSVVTLIFVLCLATASAQSGGILGKLFGKDSSKDQYVLEPQKVKTIGAGETCVSCAKLL